MQYLCCISYIFLARVQLTSLDMEVVSEESKAFANTVFLKKSMYYNMRSRIVKRHAGHVVRKASTLTNGRLFSKILLGREGSMPS